MPFDSIKDSTERLLEIGSFVWIRSGKKKKLSLPKGPFKTMDYLGTNRCKVKIGNEVKVVSRQRCVPLVGGNVDGSSDLGKEDVVTVEEFNSDEEFDTAEEPEEDTATQQKE